MDFLVRKSVDPGPGAGGVVERKGEIVGAIDRRAVLAEQALVGEGGALGQGGQGGQAAEGGTGEEKSGCFHRIRENTSAFTEFFRGRAGVVSPKSEKSLRGCLAGKTSQPQDFPGEGAGV